MFSKVKQFIVEKYFLVGLIALCAYLIYNVFQSVINPPDLQQFKGGIQNHLVWNIKGECYFVRPHTSSTTYLIRVEDCDKGSK